jgi:signal transduction histidine kinase
VLQLKDNGVGIAEAEIHNTKSIGLLGMRERAGLLGGHVQWLGAPGKGTTVTVRIPRPDAPAKNNLPDDANPSHRRPRRRAAGLEADSR